MNSKPIQHVWPQDITDEQKKVITDNGFFIPRIVGGKLCALHQYFTTTGLVVGIDRTGMERRYCYRDAHDAFEALEKLEDVNQHASGNWIKCKGVFQGRVVDLLNPNIGNFE